MHWPVTVLNTLHSVMALRNLINVPLTSALTPLIKIPNRAESRGRALWHSIRGPPYRLRQSHSSCLLGVDVQPAVNPVNFSLIEPTILVRDNERLHPVLC